MSARKLNASLSTAGKVIHTRGSIERHLKSVRAYLTSQYPTQYTLKTYFSDALGSFEDHSIDLLHIDGFHSYQAVKSDFEGWLPKLSERGIIIFHDINVYERDFGVYIFWHYVKNRYPSFEFKHSHGLGILFVGSDNDIRDIFFFSFRQR